MTSVVRGWGATLAVTLVVGLWSSSRWTRPASAMAMPPSPRKGVLPLAFGGPSLPGLPPASLTALLSPFPGFPCLLNLSLCPGVPQVCPGVPQVYMGVPGCAPGVPRCAPGVIPSNYDPSFIDPTRFHNFKQHTPQNLAQFLENVLERLR